MRLVYGHCPINANIINGGKLLEIRNSFGEKFVQPVNMIPGTILEKTTGDTLSRTRIDTK